MIHFEYKNDKFYCEDKLITLEEAENKLGHYRLLKLKRQKSLGIRGEIEEPKKQNRRKKEQKLLEENRKFYTTDTVTYKSGTKHELWRKNQKYGYYNIVTYLESLDQEIIDNAILKDLEEQSNARKTKLKIEDPTI